VTGARDPTRGRFWARSFWHGARSTRRRRSILAAGHQPDERYVEPWTRAWEVLDRWDEALRRA
jgi:hypothetical protein